MKKRKWLVTFVLTIVTCCLFSFGLIRVLATSNGELTFNGVSVEEKYDYGEKFTAPEGSLTYKGQTQDAQTTLYFPDGRVSDGVMVSLNQEGVYTLVYSASFSGEEKTYTQNFTVEKTLFTVEKPASSVVYDTYDATEHDREELGVISGSVSGAYVKLASGDKVTYNKVINLADATATDIFISLAMTPSVIGTRDVGELNIILTDAYDKNNFVTINVLDSVENKASYVKAAANCGQLLSGWDYSGNRIMSGSNPYGFAVYCLFSADASKRATIKEIEQNSLHFAMDYANREIHTAQGYSNPEYPTMIADLDNEADFGNIWNGFTTGECFLSIQCNGYIKSTAEFVITQIMGEDITSTGSFERSAPTVQIDFNGYDKNALPVGEVGKVYPLFSAQGVSPYYRSVSVSQTVDFQGAPVAIQNGAFTPSTTGVYTVTVTATDLLGQTSREVYEITVVEQTTAIRVTPLGDYETGTVAGFGIPLAEANAVGGSGRLAVEYAVWLGNTSVQTGGEIFCPTQQGTYTVKITATDFLGNIGVWEYQVVVEAGTKPVFTQALQLPKYFISGLAYDLPKITAKNYTDGSGSDVPTVIIYQDAKGERRAVNGQITPVVRNSGDLTKVIYSAQINGVEETLTAEVPTVIVRDETGIAIERLFVAQGASVVTAKKSFVEFTFFENTSVEFINPTIANGIDLRFSGNAIGANYQKVVITLTDYANAEQSLKFSYTTDGDGAQFRLNDGVTTYKATKALTNEKEVLAFTLDDNNHSLRFDTGSTLKIPVKTYANGKEYKGFESGLVYVTFSFEGVSGASSFRINNIAGKIMGNNKQDVARPKLSFLGDYGGNKAVGETATIPVIVGADVVDGKVPVYLTVTAPNGKILSDINGVLLENVRADVSYQIKLNDYGRYSVAISTTDTDGNAYPYKFEFRVEDELPPTIAVKGIVTTGKVGELITVPSATVSDNITPNKDLVLRTYLITETGNIYQMDVLAFTPQRAGVYTVRYYCADAVGNISVVSFDIVVS